MNPGGIRVERMLPIDAALLGEVLLRLRRDSVASELRWTLGSRGVAEVDVSFTTEGARWTTSARLWTRAGLTVTPAALRVEATAVDEVRVTLESTVAPGSVSGSAFGGGDAGEELTALAQAAVDELAEELLWHATRAGINA